MNTDLAQSIAEKTGLEVSEVERLIVRPKELKHGDWSFPCFPAAKNWKVSPPEAAKRLQSEIQLPAAFDRCEVVGPYLNFFLNRKVLCDKVLAEILAAKENVGREPANGRPIIVEYSSVNIAKAVHVGHLRTTLIGKSLDEIYRFLGYQVTSINHLGDWGTQFGIVYAGCEIFGRPAEPGVDELVDTYIKAANLKKAQEEERIPPELADKPNVSEIARSYFLRLEADDRAAIEFWEWCRAGSMRYLENVYERLGIHFDHYTGESFYRNMIGGVEKTLRESGILTESRGSLGVDLGKKLGFVRVFAEDGRSLYVTRDLATAFYRHETFKAEKILYVVAMQQALYFQQLIAVLKEMKHPVAETMVHVGFGFVPGMKTREGGAISLTGFVEEAKSRALAVYREEVAKRPEGIDEDAVAEKVAIGATYFYFLSNSNVKDFNFSWSEALSFQGDTGPYVQYAVARLFSIEAKAREAAIVVDETWNPALLPEESAYEIIAVLGRFKETVERAATEYEPYHIARYSLELAKALSRGYRELRVVGEEPQLAKARLALFVSARYVLASALRLIGVPVIEKM